MAISYPLTFPTHVGARSVSFRSVNQVAVSQSPFTYKQQVFKHGGEMWEADVQLPPMSRASAEIWIAWLLSLNGQYGTFLMGDPTGATARGEAGGTPVVNGAAQTGAVLSVTGASLSQTGWLKAGDYIQLGTASSATLHKVLADADTDGSGVASLYIWPQLRSEPTNASAVVVASASGVWRLAGNVQQWNVSEASIYGISFSANEFIL